MPPISPFAVASNQVGVIHDLPPMDEVSVMIRRYVSINLRIKHKLEETSSVEIGDKNRNNKHHLHVNNIGTLMVTNRKPFRVRFTEQL